VPIHKRLVLGFGALAVLSVVGLKVYEILGTRPVVALAKSPLAPILRGGEAPDLAAKDRKGNGVTLANFAGRSLLLNFWFTDCEGCREEMPSLDVLARKLGGRGLEVVALSVDDSWEKLNTYFETDPYFQGRPPAFRLVLDPKKQTPPRYGTFKYPETFLVDARGRLVARFVGSRDWSTPAALALVESLTR
jgi:peroxiredoxin